MFVMSQAELQRARRLLESSPAVPQLQTEEALSLEEAPAGMVRRWFFYAGLSRVRSRAVCMRAALLIAAVAVCAVLFKSVWLLVIAPVLLLLEYQLIRRRAFKRAESFERDYTALLLSLASGIRTGLDPLTALLEAEKLFGEDSQTRRELLKVKDAITCGLSEEAALKRFASSIAHPDLKLFRTAFILARREGSSLADCLQRLARVTRQRQSFRRKVRGAVAMQKLSSFGIAACTIVIGMIQAGSNPEAFKLALEHPLGIKLLTTGLLLIGGGLAWMLSMTRTRL